MKWHFPQAEDSPLNLPALIRRKHFHAWKIVGGGYPISFVDLTPVKCQFKKISSTKLKPEENCVLDLRNVIIPVTLLKITQALRELKNGECMEITGCDPETKKNMLKILQKGSYELLSVKDQKGLCRILIKKGLHKRKNASGL